jgi:hypothetical protein
MSAFHDGLNILGAKSTQLKFIQPVSSFKNKKRLIFDNKVSELNAISFIFLN